MDDRDKTESQFIIEINQLRNEIILLKRTESERQEADEALTKQTHLSQAFIDNIHSVALLLRAETYEVVASNKEAVKVGVVPGKTCYESWRKRKNPCPGCLFPKAWAKGKSQHFEMEDSNIIWDVYWIPVNENQFLHYAFDITERRKAENEIRSLSLITEQVSDSMLTTNLNFEITWTNKSFQSLYGYSPREILGRNPDFLNAEPTAEQIQNDIYQTVSSGQVWKGDIVNRRKDGSTFPCELLIFPVVDESGNIYAYAGHQRDITKRKRAEKALRESESLIRATIESTADGILVVSEKGQVIQMNKRFAQLWHIPEKLMETKDDQKLLDYVLNQLEEPEAFLRKVRELYKSADEECNTIKFKDGRIYERYSCPLIRENEICGRVWSFRDISERMRAEKALRESECRHRELLERMPDGIYRSTPEGKLLAVNSALVKMLGYASHEDLLKMDIPRDLYFNLEERNDILAKLQKNKNQSYIFRLKKKDGSELWVEERGLRVFNPDGRTVYYEGVLRDITERKRLQKELARAQRLETAGRIAGQIAHDFNNLLGPMTAYPTLIRDDLPPGHPVLEMVNEMEFTAIKIAEINQQLLSLGRRGHYTLEPVDLNDLLQKVVLSQNLPNELVVREELNSNLFLIKGGTAQLTRALINLINNAKEAMQYSGVLTLRTNNVYLDTPLKGYKTISTGEYVKLEVSDIGSGIEPEILEKIFDPFFTTKKMDKVRGSGLGLSVVHSIVEDHNGYITVLSMPGKCTTFSLYFPVTRDKEIAETVEKVKGGHEKILVIDDDPVQRRVAGHLLKSLGYKIHSVPSGEQAVKYVQKYPQDLLIIDMIMDGIDGTETYRQILEFQQVQKAIILSGFALSQRVKEALRMGAGAFVMKPVTLSVLATTVRKELDRKKKRRLAPVK